ncbi:GNAT family N-acetyltransferase [Micavibrio aeruginosavorus]|uniref:GNAT family N-acetyltransferase n=1 Tax=Micavibrio aeruginosavorus TaxID=349221 RepID=UPI003F4ADA6E
MQGETAPFACLIRWNVLSLDQWTERFAQARRASLLQSYDYARAACPVLGLKARWGVIEIDGAVAGLVQILETAFPGHILHGVHLDRGPVWLPGFGAPDHVAAVFHCLNRVMPRRLGRRRRFIPDVVDTPDMRDALAHAGLRARGSSYQTIWLDLDPDDDTRRAALRKSWRSELTKAQHNNALHVDWTTNTQTIDDVIIGYHADRTLRGYPGPSVKMVRALARQFFATNNLLVGSVRLQNETIAMVLVLIHGSSATYQIGWTTEAGRDYHAHHLLLWDSSVILKQRGVRDFDLGGISDDKDGLAVFKTGLGGTIVRTPGFYD